MVFSCFNDSYYCVVDRMMGIEEVKEQVRAWSIPSTIGWAISLVLLLIFSAIF